MPARFGKQRILRTPQRVSTLFPANSIGPLPMLISESQEPLLDESMLTLSTVRKPSAPTKP